VGTYCYLFTWESPAFGGMLGACHALDIPFVFGTVHNPIVQTFSGGGEGAFDLSESMRAAWTSFARTGSPSDSTEDASPLTPADPSSAWAEWDPVSRPTAVLGPWPGAPGSCTLVERPRDEDFDIVARGTAT
jgi:para-nitrobenzyl esterase